MTRQVLTTDVLHQVIIMLDLDENEEVHEKMKRLSLVHSPVSESSSSASLPGPDRFLPDCHRLVFEGGNGENDWVNIEPYQGDKHQHHVDKDTFIAVLDPTGSPKEADDKHDEFVAQFTNLMPKIAISYNEKEHGSLRIQARFGKLYYFDYPPENRMKVQDLVTFEEKNKKKGPGEVRFRSSFMPMKVPHDIVKAYLDKERYQSETEEHIFMIQVNKIIEVHKVGLQSKEQCYVVQNADFQFLELWHFGTKWIELNIIRQDSSKRDVRINVESECDTADTDLSFLHYKDAKIITKDASGGIVVNEKYRDQVNFLREKVTTKYSKSISEDFKVEVNLTRAKEYSKLNRSTGYFDVVKDWREELIIQPQVTDINMVAASEEFAKSLIELCYQFESIC